MLPKLTVARAGVIAAVIGAAGVIAAAVLQPGEDDPPPPAPPLAGICAIRGNAERAGRNLYINAALSGRSGSTPAQRVVAVGVFWRNPGTWGFRHVVDGDGDTWSIPASASWEVGRAPFEGPAEPFTFQAFGATRHVNIPTEDEELRAIPQGLMRVGDEITRTRRQLAQHRDYIRRAC